MSGILLDTCALLWLFGKGQLLEPGRTAVAIAADDYDLAISAVSAWEIALLCRPGRRDPLNLAAPPEVWFANILAEPGIRYLPLEAGSAIRSSSLPAPLHDDPADRMLIATARDNNLVLATRDARILDYAALGHVRAIAC